ncbi:glutaredoxin family protein [Gilvimarinus sp. SDUM040013]|uniref:Glutaredoxin family protein n=1 Tax=Gilvimarinus gilvus TaxID=3058038 RepID=A0ABU4RVW0_9GAMM|nr:glutaredoxin family protein [Gilvimarinus sp. SDUM040013]MDO3387850.1 glutaredoxin family protein [Gilvimarinus sp. SDUM040013]MDX6848779.1 glutaredoxin family protein [Gilvimarinus sp. SDUM040013]
MKTIVFVFIAIAVAIKIFAGSGVSGGTERVDQYSGEVVLYATPWCGYCKKTRELLRDNDIVFTEYNIEKSNRGRREYNDLNGQGIPLMVIDGQVVRGYQPRQILSLAKATQ